MTHEEIVNKLTNILDKVAERNDYSDKPMIYLNKLEQQAIREIRDKLIPVKPDDVFADIDGSLYLGWCPECNHPVDNSNKHCPKCLQKFDWSEWSDNYSC